MVIQGGKSLLYLFDYRKYSDTVEYLMVSRLTLLVIYQFVQKLIDHETTTQRYYLYLVAVICHFLVSFQSLKIIFVRNTRLSKLNCLDWVMRWRELGGV